MRRANAIRVHTKFAPEVKAIGRDGSSESDGVRHWRMEVRTTDGDARVADARARAGKERIKDGMLEHGVLYRIDGEVLCVERNRHGRDAHIQWWRRTDQYLSLVVVSSGLVCGIHAHIKAATIGSAAIEAGRI